MLFVLCHSQLLFTLIRLTFLKFAVFVFLVFSCALKTGKADSLQWLTVARTISFREKGSLFLHSVQDILAPSNILFREVFL
jgi:hypothetical protein